MKYKRKIIYFLDFPYGVGGSNKVMITQAYIMSMRGYKAVIIIPNDENGTHSPVYDEICDNYGLHTITAQYTVSASLESIDIMAVLKCFNEVLRLLIREKPDLVHSTQINAAVELAAREMQIPHLMNIYQTDLETFNIEWTNIFPQYHSADSELLTRRWGQGLGIPSGCIRVAYGNNRCKANDRVRNVSGPLQMLSIGILSERKNQLEILKFVLNCKKNGIQVVLKVLGDNANPYGEICKEYVKKNGLEKEVVFHGFVKNVEDYFAQADLMILSSRVESYPGVIVESMANKVPVLSTPVAGIPELLQDGYNGFMTKDYGSEDIYETFRRFLIYKENGDLQNVINHAYETYLRNHSYEAVGSRLERYYDWIWEDYDRYLLQIRINDVKKLFENFVEKKCPVEMELHTRNNLWFLYHLNKIAETFEFRKIVIWGAGLFGKIALEWLEIIGCRSRLVGYIDTHKTGEYLGYPILRDREKSVKNSDMILLAIGDINSCLKVMKYLEQHDKKRNKDYFMMLNAPIRI